MLISQGPLSRLFARAFRTGCKPRAISVVVGGTRALGTGRRGVGKQCMEAGHARAVEPRSAIGRSRLAG